MQYRKYHEINLYMTPGSKICELVKVYFRSNGYDFAEFDISKDEVALKKMEEISDQRKAPVTEIDGRVIVGYRPEIYDFILEGKVEES